MALSINFEFAIRLSLKAGTGNRGTERNGIEERNGTRKAGIFKTRNEKSRNL